MVEQVLVEEASSFATELQNEAGALQEEIRKLEEARGEKQEKLDAAKSAAKRLEEYKPRVGGIFQCPRCWMLNGVRSEVRNVPGDKEHDLYRCNICPAEFEVEA